MKSIPLKLRKQLADDPWMKKCCLCGKMPVEWHHSVIYQGRQVNEAFAIIPLCHHCHQVGKRLEEALYVALGRATEADLAKMPRRDWSALKSYLNHKYGPS